MKISAYTIWQITNSNQDLKGWQIVMWENKEETVGDPSIVLTVSEKLLSIQFVFVDCQKKIAKQ